MNEEHIVAEAQRRVEQEREARRDLQGGRWFWALIALLATVALGFFLYPTPLPQKLLLAMGGMCGLRPDHSYFAGRLQLPLEARDTGIYGGFSLTLAWLISRRPLKAMRIGRRITIGLLGLMFLGMVFDGVNSTLIELNRPHLYTSTNMVRLVTGLLSGIALGVAFTWLLGAAIQVHSAPSVPMLVTSPVELLGPLALCTVFGLVVVSEPGWGYYPISLLSIGGLIVLLAGVSLLLILEVRGLRGRLDSTRQIRVPTALAFIAVFSVLAGSAMLRWG